MSKKINFKAINKYGFETQIKPYPASQSIPQWWKEQTPFDKTIKNPDGKKFSMDSNHPTFSFKKCTPMLDSLTSGYIIALWADVFVENNNGVPAVSWKTNSPVFDVHGEGAKKVQSPEGYSDYVLKYINTWIPETPKGYSVLITSPFGYKNLPFMAIPAIVDSDKNKSELAFPMHIKKDFEGVVEKGTPLIQIIPFKREDWESTFDHYNDNEYASVIDKNFNGTILNHYIKNTWSKKQYK